MRVLERNKVRFWYALFKEKTPAKDASGRKTGETEVIYHNPVMIKANVSAARGEATVEQFGSNLDYDRVIVIDDVNVPVDEYSILWIDVQPVFDAEGKTDTPNDYVVKKVARSLNSVAIAVKKVR